MSRRKPDLASLLTLTPRRILVGSLAATLAFEALTLLFDFALCSDNSPTAHLDWLTYGVRIHHGFLGLLLLLLALLLRSRRAVGVPWLIVIGFGLVFSDLLHHFLVLWPITGDPQLTLFYPPASETVDAQKRLLSWTAL